jgi:hypothetical protein
MKPSNAVAHPLNQESLSFDAEGTAFRGLRGWANCFLQDKPMSDIDAEIAEGLFIVANVDKKQWTPPMSWV